MSRNLGPDVLVMACSSIHATSILSIGVNMLRLRRWLLSFPVRRRRVRLFLLQKAKTFRPLFENLEDRLVPSGRPLPLPVIYLAAETGDPPVVKAYAADTGALNFEVKAFESAFTGGVRVAAADLNGDGYPDAIVSAGSTGGPRIRVLDGKTGLQIAGPLGNFFAYDQSFTGGVNVAAADVNGDGFPDIITAAGEGGGPHVKVFSGKDGTVLASFFAFEDSFRGGVNVAAADFTGDGKAEIVVGAGNTGAPRIRILDLSDVVGVIDSGSSRLPGSTTPATVRDFFAGQFAARGGVTVGTDAKAGDVTGDGIPDLVVGSGIGSKPTVQVYSGGDGKLVSTFNVFDPSMTAGVRVATAFVTDDDYADVVVATGPGVPNRVQVYDGVSIITPGTPRLITGPLADFAPFGAGFNGGVNVGASNDPPTLLETETSTLGTPGIETLSVVSEVYDLGGEFEWMYHVTNNNFTEFGSIPGAGMFYTTFDQDLSDSANFQTTMGGWTGYSGAPVGAFGVNWVGGEKLDHLEPGQTADFWFTTDPRPIGHNPAAAADEGYANYVSGQVLGPGTMSLSMADYVPVNANNTNGSTWIAPGIPSIRDFNTNNLSTNDPELVPLTVSITPVDTVDRVVGFSSESLDPVNGGGINLWKDQKKTQQQQWSATIKAGDISATVYVEGYRSSMAMNDVTITAFPVNAPAAQKQKQITITPVLLTFVATPKNPPSVNISRSLLFANGGDTAYSYTFTSSDNNTDGSVRNQAITLSAAVKMAGLENNGASKFIQNASLMLNGLPGQKGVSYENGSTYSWQIDQTKVPAGANGALPLLDKTYDDPQNKAINNPFYNGEFSYVASEDPSVQRPVASDSPWILNVKDAYTNPLPGVFNFNHVAEIDYDLIFNTSVVWQYADGSIYNLSTLSWGVLFRALRSNGALSTTADSRVIATGNSIDHTDWYQTRPMIYNDVITVK